MTAAMCRLELEPETSDRRLNHRYPIGIAPQYTLMRYGRVVNTGEGRTLNLSSGGALIECDVALPKGLEIELSIAWPAMLDGNVALSLVTVKNCAQHSHPHCCSPFPALLSHQKSAGTGALRR